MRVINRLLESRKVGEDLDTKEEEGKKGAKKPIKKEIKKKEAKK